MTPRKLASLVAVLVALMAALVWFNAGREVYDAPLDPANPKQDGAQALAKVLDQEGVDLTIARGRAALEAQTLDADTTVVVTSAELLGRSTFKALRRAAGEDAHIIVVGSAFDLDPALPLPIPVATVSREVAASCVDPLVTDLTIYVGSDFDPAASLDSSGCFATAEGVVLAQPRTGLQVLAAPAVISNRYITKSDNAALALRLLGQRDRLVWYVADASDLSASESRSLADFVPRWFAPALALLMAGFVVMMVWKGRRFGPLVSEPIPVVVHASETTRSRGHLYQSTRSREHAAHLLRTATAHRLCASLRLPVDAPMNVLASHVADHSGRNLPEVLALLEGPQAPTSDQALVQLGQDLLTLEDEVHT